MALAAGTADPVGKTLSLWAAPGSRRGGDRDRLLDRNCWCRSTTLTSFNQELPESLVLLSQLRILCSKSGDLFRLGGSSRLRCGERRDGNKCSNRQTQNPREQASFHQSVSTRQRHRAQGAWYGTGCLWDIRLARRLAQLLSCAIGSLMIFDRGRPGGVPPTGRLLGSV